jgi:uncharacterized protein (TIGR03067 family)
MQRKTRVVLLSLFVLMLLQGSDSRDYSDATKVDFLDGKWQLIGGEVNGEIVTLEMKQSFVFHNGKVVNDFWPNMPLQYRYVADTSRKPAHLDFIEMYRGHRMELIFEVKGNRLRIGISSDWSRPKEFGQKGASTFVYERVK